MKRMICAILALIMALGCLYGVSETAEDELSRLKAENEYLRSENERLNELISAYTDPTVIVAFTGGTVTFEEVYAAYLEVEGFYTEIYEALNLDYHIDPDEEIEIQTQLAKNLADEKLIENYIAAQGIVLISDEEKTLLEVEARREYNELYEDAFSYFVSVGYSIQEAKTLTEQYLSESELDEESLIAEKISSFRSERITLALTGEITLEDEDIESTYNEILLSDMEYYSEYPEEYGFDALYSDTPIVYVPEGYRAVRMVIIPFDEDDMEAYDELYLAEETDGEEADKLYAKLWPEAEGVYNRLLGGESFEAIREEYSLTEYYMDEFGGDEGFYLSADSYFFDEETTAEIMALMTPGSVTKPLRNDWGYAIYQYVADLESGTVPLDEVKAELETLAASNKRSRLYDEALERLREEAHTAYFFDRLN